MNKEKDKVKRILTTTGYMPQVEKTIVYLYIEELENKVNQLEKQLEHYKSKEIERINEDLLQVKNDYLERCIKTMVGDINE